MRIYEILPEASSFLQNIRAGFQTGRQHGLKSLISKKYDIDPNTIGTSGSAKSKPKPDYLGVDKERLRVIFDKVNNKEQLTPQELAVFNAVRKKLKER